ncbi:MAG TPA: hypothetical protein VM221_03505 [Armatimonadota bacterium]|nr:hypothetical protein [Armatimonadota bacterium]
MMLRALPSRCRRWAPLAAWLLLAATVAGAQARADDRALRRAVWRARNQIVVDGEPTPLLWAVGVSDPAELDAYSQLGFNTVEVVIGAPTDDGWKVAEGLAQAAAARGLHVLATIPPAPEALNPAAANPWDDAYRAAVREYLKPVVERGLGLPGLVGWVVEGVGADTLDFNEELFRDYLVRRYGTRQGIAAAWGVPISEADALTESFVGAVDSHKPLGLGQASVDLARYRSDLYRGLLNVWAQEIRARDRHHVVLAGRQHSYRAAISVPDGYDGMLLGLYPGVAEDDVTTHNVHGVDLARRGNQFAALPVLKVTAARSGAELASWIELAVLHGAAGIGFADWKDLRDNEALRSDARAALAGIREARLCPRVPTPTAAVLYEPFAAGGFASGRPLYGWLTGASISEPGRLLRVLARGTGFGQVDYLAESGVAGAALDRYQVIIAPLAVSLTGAEQAALARYVASGGTLIADLGAGFAQSHSLEVLPPDLAELFGVAPAAQGTEAPGSPPVPSGAGGIARMLQAAALTMPHPRFPSLTSEMAAGGSGQGSFDLPIYSVTLSGGAAPVLCQWASATAFAGIIGRQAGRGWALYATTRLWQNWLPGDAVFDAFHSDLLGLDSPIAVKRPPGLIPQDAVGLYQDGSVMVLKRSSAPTEVLLRNPEGRVYRIRGGMQEIRPAGASPNSLLIFGHAGLQAADPLPIEISTEALRVTVAVAAYADGAVSLALYGPASRLAPRPGSELAVAAGGEATAHVRISSGDYRVRRGSRHEIAIRGLLGRGLQVRTMTAGEDGVLAFDAPANTVVTVTPVAGGNGG